MTSRTVQVAVGNGRYYGGGMVVTADAAIDDHVLHVYSLEVAHWWEVVALFPALRRGAHLLAAHPNADGVRTVQIETRRRRLVDVNGGLAAHTPARFRILPGAVTVLAPMGDD